MRNIVSEDDSPIRALLIYYYNHPRGKLNVEIHEPGWLADLSHRTKVVAKPVFALATVSKIKSSCTNVDVIRMKKYHDYILKTNRMKTIAEIKVASKAVIEHLFNNHDYCDFRWCRPKKHSK